MLCYRKHHRLPAPAVTFPSILVERETPHNWFPTSVTSLPHFSILGLAGLWPQKLPSERQTLQTGAPPSLMTPLQSSKLCHTLAAHCLCSGPPLCSPGRAHAPGKQGPATSAPQAAADGHPSSGQRTSTLDRKRAPAWGWGCCGSGCCPAGVPAFVFRPGHLVHGCALLVALTGVATARDLSPLSGYSVPEVLVTLLIAFSLTCKVRWMEL